MVRIQRQRIRHKELSKKALFLTLTRVKRQIDIRKGQCIKRNI